jgi:hypothetical protein
MTGSAISALAALDAPALHDYIPVARGATNKKADLFDFALKSDLTTALTAYYTKTEVDASQASQDTAIAARALASDVATSLALKAPLASPTLTGNPLAPTQADNDNSTKIATTAFVHSLITALIGTAPGTLDTLQEIAAALTADESTASALATTVATKLAKASNLSDLADIPTARGNLGLGTAALVAVTSLLTAANNLSDLTNVATAQDQPFGLFESGGGCEVRVDWRELHESRSRRAIRAYQRDRCPADCAWRDDVQATSAALYLLGRHDRDLRRFRFRYDGKR